jgi:hypothetical protein
MASDALTDAYEAEADGGEEKLADVTGERQGWVPTKPAPYVSGSAKRV